MAQGESVRASLIHRDDLPKSGIVALDAVINGENESILLHCEGGNVFAWLNVCPHEGRRLDYAPGKFLIDKDRLVCAAHGASFRLADGFCVSGPCRGSSLREVAVAESDEGVLSFGPLR